MLINFDYSIHYMYIAVIKITNSTTMINIDNIINGTYCTGNFNKTYTAPDDGSKKKRKKKSKFKFNLNVISL